MSVTPDWVKVAAYTCEFDAIVVLGFPTKAIDLVAPGKTRPTVGMRLLVVSQFTYRGNDPNTQGVQADITMGPRTLGDGLPMHMSSQYSIFFWQTSGTTSIRSLHNLSRTTLMLPFGRSG